ncbi:MAG: NAD(P)/FAD-dependent oxidoreductase [Bacteroidota bacterium]
MEINIPATDRQRVVILGAGFAGLTLARKLVRSDFQVVLIDRNNYHQFQPLFYQVAMSGLEPSSIVFPLRKIFQRNEHVHIRVTEVLSVVPERNEVITELGSLEYDHLVVAIGADTNFFGNQDMAEKTIPMKSVSEALYLRNQILADYESACVTPNYDDRQGFIDIVIVGGGPTGVEVAGSLAEMKKYILPKDYKEIDSAEVDIHLVQGGPQLLMGMSEKASQKALDFLQKLKVHVKLDTRVTGYDGQTVFMSDGSEIHAHKVIWAAGIIGNTIEGLDPELIARGRRIKVDQYNKVLSTDNIYAVGDVAYMETEAYPHGHPQVAQVAMQQAALVGKNLKRAQKGKALKTFKYKDLGSMATVGRHRAVVDLPKFSLAGGLAWFMWLGVHLFQLIGTKNRVFVFLNWVWNYLTYDQSLRVMIRPYIKQKNKSKTTTPTH